MISERACMGMRNITEARQRCGSKPSNLIEQSHNRRRALCGRHLSASRPYLASECLRLRATRGLRRSAHRRCACAGGGMRSRVRGADLERAAARGPSLSSSLSSSYYYYYYYFYYYYYYHYNYYYYFSYYYYYYYYDYYYYYYYYYHRCLEECGGLLRGYAEIPPGACEGDELEAEHILLMCFLIIDTIVIIIIIITIHITIVIVIIVIIIVVIVIIIIIIIIDELEVESDGGGVLESPME